MLCVVEQQNESLLNTYLVDGSRFERICINCVKRYLLKLITVQSIAGSHCEAWLGQVHELLRWEEGERINDFLCLIKLVLL